MKWKRVGHFSIYFLGGKGFIFLVERELTPTILFDGGVNYEFDFS